MKLSRRSFIKITSAALASGLFPGFAFSKNLIFSDVIFLTPRDKDYLSHRQIFNKRIISNPFYIAVCLNEDGVRQAINFATINNLPIAIKSGGHSFEGFSLNDNGLVIDLSLMNKLSLNKDGELVASPGAIVSEINNYLVDKKRIIPLGTCGNLGLAGLTLGGGYGLLSRSMGLTCDNLTGLQMFDGNANKIDSTDNKELLWACRGGGNGNFGIVTELRFKTHKAPGYFNENRFIYSNLISTKAINLIELWFSEMLNLPNDAFSSLIIGSNNIKILIIHYKEDSKEQISKIRKKISRNADEIKTEFKIAFDISIKKYYGRSEPIFFKTASAGFYKGYEDIKDIIGKLLSHILKTDGMVLQINTLGGAISNPDLISTSAFPHRMFPFLGKLSYNWDNESDTESKLKSFNTAQKIIKEANIHNHYRNYESLEISDHHIAYYGKYNYERLKKLKKSLDPNNRIRHPQSI